MTQDVIGILGSGAVGHLLAHFCHSIPETAVQMLGRSGLWSETKAISDQTGRHTIILHKDKPLAQFWFCALKSYALQDGLRPLLQELSPQSQIIILSNGYVEPLLQDLRQEFPKVILRKGLITRGIRPAAEGGFIMGTQGQVIWGDDRAMTRLEKKIFASLSAHGFLWHPDSCRLRLEKWFYNTCLNTICGVYRLARNADAVAQHGHELAALSVEVLALAQELWLHWQPVHQELWQNLLSLIAQTADNENSMAADLRLGRMNEAGALSGLVRLARDPHIYPLLLAYDRKLASI